MLKFVTSIKKKYRERLLHREKQWPAVSGDKLINLELVKGDKKEGFRAGLPQHGASDKRTPILHGDLFKSEDGKKPVRKVLIEGNGGMGKTTLCTMLAEGWAEGKLFTQFECVILLPLREKSVSSATTLPQLFKLLHSSERIRTSTVEELEDNEGDGVLIIADGWDELDDVNRSDDSFLYSLLFGDLLPFASVLLTSRPSASAPLHDLPFIDRLVELVGFNAENIKQYIESEFEKYPEKVSPLIEQLESNPIIQSVCSVPLNCAIVCYLWHTLDQELPSTQTELFTQIVLNVIFRGIRKKFPNCSIGKSLDNFNSIPEELQDMFWLTCKFAYECFSRDKIVFSEKELASSFPEGLDSNDKFLCFGLLQSAQSLLPVGHGLSFHFLHLTFQEFLAALHLVHLPTEEQLQFCKAYAKNSRFVMVWRFAFGLGSKKQGSHGVGVSSKAVCLDGEVVDRFVSALTGFHDRLLLCHCALESQDSIISTKVTKRIHGQFTAMGTIAHTAHDCVAVFHVLRHTSCCPDVEIDMSGCGPTRELADILSSAGGQLNIRYLRLDNNKLTDKFFTDLFVRASASFSSLENIGLDGNNTNDIMTPLIMHTSCESLTVLRLSNNPLGVAGIQSLERAVQAGVLDNLQWLYLSNTLTDDADVNGALLTTLLTSFTTHCPHLLRLDLSRNNLGVPGACAIGQSFPLLEFIPDLNETNLSSEAVTAFSTSAVSKLSLLANSFSSTPSLYFTLDLSDNPIGYDGLLAIFRMLRSYTNLIASLELTVDNTDLTTHESRSDTISDIEDLGLAENDSFDSLSVNGNNFSRDGVVVLAECIRVCHSLRTLESCNCSLASVDITSLLSILESSGTSFENLELWRIKENFIDRDGITAIMEHLDSLFPSLYNIELDDNPLSEDDEQLVQDYLKIRRKQAMLTEWERTCSPPQSDELLLEFYIMWDKLLQRMVDLADEYLFEYDVSESDYSEQSTPEVEFWEYIDEYNYDLEVSTKDEPAGDQQPTLEVSPSPPPSDDESFHSATEELDELAGHNPTASDETTCHIVKPSHRMDQQETFSDPEVSSPSTSSNTATAAPRTLHSGLGGLKTITINELKDHTGVSDSKIGLIIEDKHMYGLSGLFDGIEEYLPHLELIPAQQRDVRDEAFKSGTQAGMFKALRLWKQRNPLGATYKNLLGILLSMGKGSITVQVCEYLSSKCESD